MEVLGTINRGGFGRVERVRLADGSEVARKVFDPEPSAVARTERDRLRLRFVREVRVQSSLPSEFFLPILEHDLSGESPWFLMPIAEQNFAQDIAQRRRTGAPKNTAALADILNALEELHSLGYIHRDLKPANVLLHEDVWKLSDFGFVQPSDGRTGLLTSFQSGWGTQQYCAPEQAQDFRSSTSAVDIYAFGCIIHDIYGTAKRIPYQKQSCPGPVGWVIEKCTEVDASRRFRSIASLRDALFSVLSEKTSSPSSPEAKEWAKSLKDVEGWALNEFESFVRYLTLSRDSTAGSKVFYALDETRLRALHALHPQLWSDVAREICKWAQGSFNFEYCDVIVDRLECINQIGDLDSKANAIIATAILGASHHRWYVMRRLLSMCGHDLDERLATRIAIQIRVDEVQHEFRRCAEEINRPLNSYHHRIAAVLA